MRSFNVIALAILVIGGINWLLVGLFSVDIVAAIFGGETGQHSPLTRIVYVVVGLAALYCLTLFRSIAGQSDHLPHRAADRQG